jgi:hypothetical protein
LILPSKLNGRVHHSYHSHRENWKQREINQAAKKARIDAGGYTGAKTPKPAPAPKTKAAPKAKTPKGPAAAPIVVNELICRRVQRFWPDEGGWFDAIITDYRPTTNEHCLTYEINTPNETFRVGRHLAIRRAGVQTTGGQGEHRGPEVLQPGHEGRGGDGDA